MALGYTGGLEDIQDNECGMSCIWMGGHYYVCCVCVYTLEG